jgi:hypothetical protein
MCGLLSGDFPVLSAGSPLAEAERVYQQSDSSGHGKRSRDNERREVAMHSNDTNPENMQPPIIENSL